MSGVDADGQSERVMSKDFKLPSLGEEVEEGDIVAVLVSQGDEIDPDQNVVEIETDKATIEVPCPFGGKVSKVHVREGDHIKVGDALISVDGAGAAEGKDEDGTKKEGTAEEGADKPAAKEDKKKPSRDGRTKQKEVEKDEAAGEPEAEEPEAEPGRAEEEGAEGEKEAEKLTEEEEQPSPQGEPNVTRTQI